MATTKKTTTKKNNVLKDWFNKTGKKLAIPAAVALALGGVYGVNSCRSNQEQKEIASHVDNSLLEKMVNENLNLNRELGRAESQLNQETYTTENLSQDAGELLGYLVMLKKDKENQEYMVDMQNSQRKAEITKNSVDIGRYVLGTVLTYREAKWKADSRASRSSRSSRFTSRNSTQYARMKALKDVDRNSRRLSRGVAGIVENADGIRNGEVYKARVLALDKETLNDQIDYLTNDVMNYVSKENPDASKLNGYKNTITNMKAMYGLGNNQKGSRSKPSKYTSFRKRGRI
ncbi:hypothetical protein KY321_00795 [Candidatus Woesearchaeota archaeon]|nr:hypothetical protein [Candidatus Woesearchaeota archaeon]